MSASSGESKLGLLERLDAGPVICAEGYLFELERRGYIQAGAFVPEVVLEEPDVVRQLHRDFARAGSDIIEAFTYYAHREKLRLIGKEDLLEPMNRNALSIARGVADEFGGLLAGNICNTNIYEIDDPETHKKARAMFEEQVGWAAEADIDLIIGETFGWFSEALTALEVMKQTGKPTVITLALHRNGLMREGITPAEACKRLEDAGADVVGLNCIRGPASMKPFLQPIRDAVSCHVAALPVPYRTNEKEPTFQSLTDHACGCIPDGRPFPVALDPLTCNRYEIAEFTRDALEIGVNYLGVCCGAGPHHIRSMAEAMGREVIASRYSPDMTLHAYYGKKEAAPGSNQAFASEI